MDLLMSKIVVLLLLGFVKLISGLAPLVFVRIFKKRSEKFSKKFIGK